MLNMFFLIPMEKSYRKEGREERRRKGRERKEEREREGRRGRGRKKGACTNRINLPAPGRRHPLYIHLRVSRGLCF